MGFELSVAMPHPNNPAHQQWFQPLYDKSLPKPALGYQMSAARVVISRQGDDERPFVCPICDKVQGGTGAGGFFTEDDAVIHVLQQHPTVIRTLGRAVDRIVPYVVQAEKMLGAPAPHPGTTEIDLRPADATDVTTVSIQQAIREVLADPVVGIFKLRYGRPGWSQERGRTLASYARTKAKSLGVVAGVQDKPGMIVISVRAIAASNGGAE